MRACTRSRADLDGMAPAVSGGITPERTAAAVILLALDTGNGYMATILSLGTLALLILNLFSSGKAVFEIVPQGFGIRKMPIKRNEYSTYNNKWYGYTVVSFVALCFTLAFFAMMISYFARIAADPRSELNKLFRRRKIDKFRLVFTTASLGSLIMLAQVVVMLARFVRKHKSCVSQYREGDRDIEKAMDEQIPLSQMRMGRETSIRHQMQKLSMLPNTQTRPDAHEAPKREKIGIQGHELEGCMDERNGERTQGPGAQQKSVKILAPEN